MIKGLVFDFDGLIIDTETTAYLAYKEVFEQDYDVTLPLDLWALNIGTSNDHFDPFAYLQEQSGQEIDTEQTKQKIDARFKQLMAQISPRPGVVTYLETAKALGLKIGLATSSNRQWAHRYLTQFHLLDYFDSINTANDVTRIKPDPELLWWVQRAEKSGGSRIGIRATSR